MNDPIRVAGVFCERVTDELHRCGYCVDKFHTAILKAEHLRLVHGAKVRYDGDALWRYELPAVPSGNRERYWRAVRS